MKTELSKQAIQELLHNEIAGLNSPEQSARLREYVKLNQELDEELRGLQELAAMLKRVEHLTPRPHLSARIMKTIRETSSIRSAPAGFFARLTSMSFIREYLIPDRTQLHHRNSLVSNSPHYTNPGGYMKNKLMIGGVTLTVLTVVYVAFLYPWPAGQGTEGTIGGVKKYNAHQLAEKDVQLQDITAGSVDQEMILSFYNSAPLADREAFERTHNIDKAAYEKAAVEKAPIERMSGTEKAAYEKAAVEKAPIEKAPVEKAPIEKMSGTEKAAYEKAAVEKAPYEKAAVEKAAIEKAPYEKAAIEKAPIERMSGMEKAAYEKAALERALVFWNQASVEAKSTFAKSWLERSGSLERQAVQQ